MFIPVTYLFGRKFLDEMAPEDRKKRKLKWIVISLEVKTSKKRPTEMTKWEEIGIMNRIEKVKGY